MLIKLNNLDCFRFDNYCTEVFESLEKCCKKCDDDNINVFIIYKNFVYYREQNFNDCAKNLVYMKDAVMYLYNIELKYYINDNDRINKYTSGIIDKDQYKCNNFLNKNEFLEHLKNIKKHEWKFQHYNNFNILSVFLVIVSLLFLIFKGLNFGIDFKGGTLIELRSTDTKINVSSLRDRFNQMNLGDVSVKKFGNETDFLIKFEK